MLPLHLDWSAPLECPTGEQVQQDLSRITRTRPGRVLVPLTARATITHKSDSYYLSLQLTRHGELSEAHFESKVCAPLRKAATLVLALAYGDGLEIKEDSSDTSDSPAAAQGALGSSPSAFAPARPNVQRDEADERRPSRRPGSRLETTPWVAAAWTSGFIGPSATGAEAGVGLGGRYWQAFSRFSAFPPEQAATGGGVAAELSALSGSLGGCALVPSPALPLAGCLAFEAGFVRAHSNGAVQDGAASAPWLALNPAAVLLWPIVRPFALRLELGALIPLDAPRFDVPPLGTLYATAHVAPRVSAGLSVDL